MQTIFKQTLAFSIFLILFLPLFGQQLEEEFLLKQHIKYLSDDLLEGRATGSEGAKLAQDYIIAQFKEIGLTPISEEDSWLQAFDFKDGRTLGEQNQLAFYQKNKLPKKIAQENWTILNDNINASFDANIVSVGNGIYAPEVDHNDFEKIKPSKLNKAVWLMQDGHSDPNPHSKLAPFGDITLKVKYAQQNGAQAVFLKSDDCSLLQKKVTSSNIAVVCFEELGEISKKTNANATLEVSPKYTRGNNVLGYLDNGAENTVVIGAHYDHLGYGEKGSLHVGEPAIHNGADDNASGVALVIELARFLKQDTCCSNNNYLFVCFSGEELGLLGSNSFVKNPPFLLSSTNYMLNFDMVGRLDTSEQTLIINGTGTAIDWNTLDEIDSVFTSINFKSNPSGVGPSDHTQFYFNDIPALHFFTGAHEDYHRPSDDEEKINYDGLLTIQKVVARLIINLDKTGKIVFQKTAESPAEETPRFTVGLGVIPDYLFDGKGMRIDGVREGKVADKATMLKGDIVTKMGVIEVVDMMSYMKALSQFKKGDSTTVVIKRGDQTMEKKVTFF